MTTEQTKTPRYFSVADAAIAMGTSKQAVHQLINRGRLEAVKTPKGCRFACRVSVEAVERWTGRVIEIVDETPLPPPVLTMKSRGARKTRPKMKAVTFCVRASDYERLVERAAAAETTVSDLVRRAVSQSLQAHG